MPSAVITGVTGQDGSYLAEFLLEKGYTVVGIVRRTSTENNGRIAHLQDDLVLEAGDLHDQYSIIEILQRHRPDEVYNLAAQSFVPASWRQPVLTGEVTALGATRMLEAIRAVDPAIKFYQASSSEMFGQVQEWPQKETTPFYPRSPYGVAKLYAHWITINYRESYDMFACSGICFNHESPRRGMEFVTRKLTYSAARVHHGVVTSVPFGDLSTKRDWGYAPDFVRGMWMMLQQEEPRDYVLATGETHSGLEFADLAFDHIGKSAKDHITTSEDLLRPAEVEHLFGDPGLIRKDLGWEPSVTFAELVRLMVDADIELVASEIAHAEVMAGRRTD
ncbi:MAG: GDP-mannose 4,6-dehydratase [Chloroflexi bacterium]|nr:GDP-mannose 4,6-dehydratase [Chloroflexota bacterium]|tara:strand:- start:735 stop:1736 length:1002 start_codon:yes stop_codon:yes gene_type:complete